jgi:hypothetical protein
VVAQRVLLLQYTRHILNQKLLPGKLNNLAEKEGEKIEFVVGQRAGSKTGHVDTLSRHVGAVLQEGILDRKNILQEQAKDAFCTKQVARANKKSYLNNKFWYDRKAKQRKFEVNDFVYLYNPAMKPGLSRKFLSNFV